MSLNLTPLLTGAVRRHGDRIALRINERAWSYAELDQDSNRLAACLRAHGVAKGDAVALLIRNRAEYVIADLAILKLAAVKVPLNELMSGDEAAYCLEHSGARLLIAEADLAANAVPNGGTLQHRLTLDAEGPLCWSDAMACPDAPIATECSADDPALIMYTGGTTGHPKGVLHLQGGLGACLLAHVICAEVARDEVMMLASPLPHSAGFLLQACLLQGGATVLVGKFDAAAFLATAAATGATWTFAVPTMLYRLFDAVTPGAAHPFRTIVYGAAPMGRERLLAGKALFGDVFVQLYGQSESPNFITSLSKDDHRDPELLGSCGRAVPFAELRICDEAGVEQPEGTVGEVRARTPYVMRGYAGDPEATALALDDGWLRTGDLGRLDANGYLFLVDRAKDMIISGGFNIYSVEVEAALRGHPAVADVAVVGLPDEDWGERVVAVVVRARPVEAEELRSFGRAALTAYKAPKTVTFVEALPLTKFGKIDKKRLRAMLTAPAPCAPLPVLA